MKSNWMFTGVISAALCAMPLFAQDAKPAPAKPAAQDAKPADAKPAQDKPAEKAAPVLCPVSGEQIDKKSFTYFKNRRVYFCCSKCMGKFEKNPAQYTEGVTKQWDADKLLRVQVTCPVSGKPADRKLFVEGDNDRIYFADEDSKKKWNGSDQAMRNRLEEQCYSYQPLCPIGGEMIDPAAVADIDGKKVYFCCEKCVDKFKKDQAANMKKLDETIKANRGAHTRRVLAEKLGSGKK
ncbi:MAG: hypothetical protein JNG88_05165 [Phycisphaerales bacterium]|nr:hypothetical protein [Phycisphaerales bacterium]